MARGAEVKTAISISLAERGLELQVFFKQDKAVVSIHSVSKNTRHLAHHSKTIPLIAFEEIRTQIQYIPLNESAALLPAKLLSRAKEPSAHAAPASLRTYRQQAQVAPTVSSNFRINRASHLSFLFD